LSVPFGQYLKQIINKTIKQATRIQVLIGW